MEMKKSKRNVHTALKSSCPAVSKISVNTSRPSTENCFRYVARRKRVNFILKKRRRKKLNRERKGKRNKCER
jgi:hypothetical protein